MTSNNDKSINNAIQYYTTSSSYHRTEDAYIHDALSDSFIESCKRISAWVGRTPHVYPFASNSNSYSNNRTTSYQLNIILLASEANSPGLLAIDLESDLFYLNVSNLIRTIVKVLQEWSRKVDSDAILFSIFNQFDLNLYMTMTSREKEIVYVEINKLSEILREELMNDGHRKKVHSFKRNSTENYKQVMKVTHSAWSRFNKILLMRLDWGFKKQVPDLRAKFQSTEDYEQRFKIVSNYRKIMLKALREKFGSSLAFFVWKIEYGPIKGLHMHWIIGVDGSKHQDRINVPKSIVEMWDKKIADPNAYTWNLNALQSNENAILRVINYSDPLREKIVGAYADYLTKIDYEIRLRTPVEGLRSFGTSKIPKEKGMKPGPKRLKSMNDFDIFSVRRPLSELGIKQV